FRRERSVLAAASERNGGLAVARLAPLCGDVGIVIELAQRAHVAVDLERLKRGRVQRDRESGGAGRQHGQRERAALVIERVDTWRARGRRWLRIRWRHLRCTCALTLSLENEFGSANICASRKAASQTKSRETVSAKTAHKMSALEPTPARGAAPIDEALSFRTLEERFRKRFPNF